MDPRVRTIHWGRQNCGGFASSNTFWYNGNEGGL